MQNLVLLVVAAAVSFLGVVFLVALLAGVGWKWGRGQVVVAHYEINPDHELAKVRWNSKEGSMEMKRPPVCVACAEDKRQKDLHEQIEAAKEDFC
jgi:hypothetical protein